LTQVFLFTRLLAAARLPLCLARLRLNIWLWLAGQAVETEIVTVVVAAALVVI
jgi:hypothetical protein